MKHCLVTGGAGFIGSHLADRLLADGWRVTVIDNLDRFYEREVKLTNVRAHLGNEHYRFCEGDIRKIDDLSQFSSEQIDAIVHLAAKAGVRPSISDPLGYQDVNVYGTQNLLEFARDCKVTQFVFASSSSVYGLNPHVPWRESDQGLLPISPYASTKLSAEFLGHVYSHLHGIRFIALRLFTVYGPRQRPDLAIHKFTRNIALGQSIPVYGNGQTRRDYTYIDDIINGMCSALKYNSTPFEVINLGNHNTVSLNELIHSLEILTGHEALIDQLPEQIGDVPQTWADISKASALLNYSPATSLIEGLTTFLSWFRTLAHDSTLPSGSELDVCPLPVAFSNSASAGAQ